MCFSPDNFNSLNNGLQSRRRYLYCSIKKILKKMVRRESPKIVGRRNLDDFNGFARRVVPVIEMHQQVFESDQTLRAFVDDRERLPVHVEYYVSDRLRNTYALRRYGESSSVLPYTRFGQQRRVRIEIDDVLVRGSVKRFQMRFDERHLRTGADRSDHVRDVFVVRPADERGDPGLQRLAYLYIAQQTH